MSQITSVFAAHATGDGNMESLALMDDIKSWSTQKEKRKKKNILEIYCIKQNGV